MKRIKIAIIVNRMPSLESGAEVRNYYLINALKKHFDVKIYIPTFKNISFLEASGDVKLIYKLFFTLIGRIPYVEKLKKAQFTDTQINEIKNADIIQVQEMESYFTIEKFFSSIKGKKILDTHNIDYIRFLSETENKNFIEKYIGRFLGRILKILEEKAVRKFDKILVCSSLEKKYFSNIIKPDNIFIIPNGARIDDLDKNSKIQKNSILFMGLLGYQPNADGLKYYIEKIHPQVVQQIPSAKLIILGKDAPEWLKEIGRNNSHINLMGFVDNVRTYIESANVCICPLLSGSGTRLKILEYMAMGKPVVSTSIGAEGIKVKNGYDILIADSEEEFANAIIEVINTQSFAKKLGENARKNMEENYEWSEIGKKLVKIFKNIKYE